MFERPHLSERGKKEPRNDREAHWAQGGAKPAEVLDTIPDSSAEVPRPLVSEVLQEENRTDDVEVRRVLTTTYVELKESGLSDDAIKAALTQTLSDYLSHNSASGGE